MKLIKVSQFDYVLLYLPMYIAKEKFFSKYGLDVQIDCAKNDDQVVENLIKNHADLGIGDPSMAAIANEAGINCECIGQLVHKAPSAIVSLNQLHEKVGLDGLAKSLIGAKISSYPKPSTTFSCLTLLLKKAKIDKNVEILETEFSDELGALFSAEVEFATITEPTLSAAICNGAKLVHDFVDDFDTMTFSGITVTKKFSKKKENKKKIETFLKCIQLGIDVIFDDFETAHKIAQEYFPHIEKTVLLKAIHNLIDKDIFTRTLEVKKKDWKLLMNLRIKTGELKKYKFEEVVNNSYLPKV